MPVATAATSRPTRHRVPHLALLTANAISLVGNHLTGLEIPWFVLENTGSATRAGLVAIGGLVPTVPTAFFGDALVDRLGF